MVKMQHAMITIRPDQKEFLKAHREINFSGLVRIVIDKEMARIKR